MIKGMANPLGAAREQQRLAEETAKQERIDERNEKLTQLRIRTQTAKSEAYKSILVYCTNVGVDLTTRCTAVDPQEGLVDLARAQGAIAFINGMRAFYENAEREAAELEKQTTG